MTAGVVRNQALQRILDQLPPVRSHARATMAGLTPAQVEWKPGPAAWSIGQCLEHLVVTHELYEPKIPALMEQARAGGRPPVFDQWGTTWFGRLLARSVTPGSRRVRTSAVFSPAPHPRPAVLEALLGKFDDLERWIRNADGLDLSRIKVSSPVSRLLRYNLGEAFHIVVVHAERHLQQADRVKLAPGFPA